jgi:hypothetical protein
MKTVQLTQGYVSLVDDEDYDRIMAVGSWHAWVGKRQVYAKHGVSGGKTILLHRFVMGVTGRCKVDHEDTDGLNNQKCNLRVATTKQNAQNRRKLLQGTSKYKGVCKRIRKGRPPSAVPWIALIGTGQKNQLYLGSFASEKEAALAYDAAARQHFGEFANTNFAA